MKKKLSLGVIICTYNRTQYFINCMQVLADQDYCLTQLIVIENVSQGCFWSKKKLQKFFPYKLSITYVQTRSQNMSRVRNLGLKYLRTDIVMFIDDDIVLTRGYFTKLIYHYQKFPKDVAVVGPINSITPGYWQRFCECVANSAATKKEKQFVNWWPNGNLSLRLRWVKQKKLSYDLLFPTTEDLDFCAQIIARGGRITWSPALVVNHHYIDSLKDFIRKFNWYYVPLKAFIKKYPDNKIFDTDFVYRYPKLNLFNRIWEIIKRANQMRQNFRLPLQYIFACSVYYYVLGKAAD